MAMTTQLFRAELVALLNQADSVPLTLLLAPAGSGKSTLLNQWQQQAGSRQVVFFPIQPADDDPVQFLRRFAEVTRSVVAEFDTSWFMPFDVSGISPDTIAEALFDALQQVRDPLFIILDDFQRIRNPQSLHVLNAMMQRPPSGVHLIIASRTRLPLHISPLKLTDRMQELNAESLRMDRDDVVEMNLRLGGKPLRDTELDHLMAVTEGWVAGVKIALMANLGCGSDTILDFNAAQPDIMDYFGHVVLKGLPEHARTLFLQSSLLDRFNAELCDAVLESKQSARMLDQLSRRELFIMPLAGSPGWFRYHALLREFLQARVMIEMPECVAPVHRRATDYFLQRNQFEQALWHAQRASDEALLIRSLAIAFDFWLREGYASEILSWAEQLSDDQVLANMDLASPLINTLTLSRRFHCARYYLDGLKTESADPSSLQFLELHLQLFQHDTDFMEGADLEPLMGSASHRDLRAFSLAMVAYHHLQHGRLQQALECASRARTVLLQLGHRFTAAYADLIIAMSNQQLGHVSQAVAFVTDQFAETDRDSPSWVLKSTAMVVVLYDQNRLEEARRLCEDLLPMVSTASATEVISTVYLTLARLHHHQGNRKQSDRILEKLLSILQLGNYRRFVSATVLEMMRQAYVEGSWAKMEVTAERFDLHGWIDRQRAATTPMPYSQCRERRGLTAVYWLLAQGRDEDATRLLVRLREMVSGAGVQSRAVVMDSMLALLQFRQVAPEKRGRDLDALIIRYGLPSFSRSLMDEVPGLEQQMSELWQAGILVLPESYVRQYPTVFAEQQTASVLRVNPGSVLTPREFEIFELLQSGMSNAQIGDKTGISVTTIKWHLKNIYSKLGVSNRTEVVLLNATR